MGTRRQDERQYRIDLDRGQINLKAALRIPIRSLKPFWLINPYFPVTMTQAVLQQHGDEWCIVIVQGSTWAQPHMDLNHCLRDFLGLFDAEHEPEKVLAFVQKYGFADFCPHPYEEASDSLPMSIPWRMFSECPLCDPTKLPRRELVRAYVMCARQLRAALRLVAHLRIGVKLNERRHAEDVSALYFGQPKTDWFFDLETGFQWQQLTYVSYAWLNRAAPEIWPVVSKNGDGVSVQIFAKTLIEILALQFTAAITATEGLYVCDECEHPFEKDRKPRSDRDTLCTTCAVDRKKKQLRLAYKEKLASEGRPRVRKSGYLAELPAT
jgi:hypothetical protein